MTIRNSVVRKWAHQYRPGLLVSVPPVAPSYNHFAPEAVIAFRPAITINRLYFEPDHVVQPCSTPLLVGQPRRDTDRLAEIIAGKMNRPQPKPFFRPGGPITLRDHRMPGLPEVAHA